MVCNFAAIMSFLIGKYDIVKASKLYSLFLLETFNKLMSVFHASVLLLIMNCVVTLSK